MFIEEGPLIAMAGQVEHRYQLVAFGEAMVRYAPVEATGPKEYVQPARSRGAASYSGSIYTSRNGKPQSSFQVLRMHAMHTP